MNVVVLCRCVTGKVSLVSGFNYWLWVMLCIGTESLCNYVGCTVHYEVNRIRSDAIIKGKYCMVYERY